MNEKISKIENEIKALRGVNKADRDEYAKKFTEIFEQLKSLKNDVKRMTPIILTHENRIKTLETNLIEEINTYKKEINEKCRDIKNDMHDIKLEIGNIKSDINKVNKTLEPIQNELENLIFVSAAIRQEGSNKCAYLREDDYCTVLKLPYSKSGLNMTPETEGDKIVYVINVKKHPLICAACPFYKKGISFPLYLFFSFP